MPAGRPKKEISILPEGWEKEILDLYKVGASDVEIRALIYEWLDTFSDDLWYRWIEEEPRFSRTIKRGKELSQAFWEKTGRTGLWFNPKGEQLNATLWFMNMKNRFHKDWKDKHEEKGEEDNKIGGIEIVVKHKSDGENS